MKKNIKKLVALLGAMIMILVLGQNLEVVQASELPEAEVSDTGVVLPYTDAEVKDSAGSFMVSGETATYSYPVYSWNTNTIETSTSEGYMYKIDPAEGQIFSLKIEYTGTDENVNLYGTMYYPMDAAMGEYCLTESYFSLNVDNTVEIFNVPNEAYLYLSDVDWSDVVFTLSKMENISVLKNNAINVTKADTITKNISEYSYIHNDENFVSRGYLTKTTLKPGQGYSVSLEDNDNGNARLIVYEESKLGVEAYEEEISSAIQLFNKENRNVTYYIWVASVYGEAETLTVNFEDIEMVRDIKPISLFIDAKPTVIPVEKEPLNVITKQYDENGIAYNEFTTYVGNAYSVELPANSIYRFKVEYTGEMSYLESHQFAEVYIIDENNYQIDSCWASDYKDDFYENKVNVYALSNSSNTAKKYYFVVSGTYDEGNVQISVESVPEVKVSYRTHIQSIGWEAAEGDISKWKSNGAMSGTSGKAKRLEGINIVVNCADENKDLDLGIQYTTHCQSYGWLPWSANGEMNGTEGEAKRLEAISIKLTGTDAICYDVYYRVHAQSYGWLNWAQNGGVAGTAGYGKRLEGIQIVVVKKGTAINEKLGGIQSVKAESYIAKEGVSPVVNFGGIPNSSQEVPGDQNINVAYRTHVQSFGWQGWKYNGQMSGTSGKSKRLEGINIKLTNQKFEGDIVYTTHVQKYGWQGKLDDQSTWKKNGQMAGTSGEAKRLEAICINLTGEMAEHYDIYYRVHAQSYGWLGWVKNGNPAGTAGYGKRLEGIQIVLVPKGHDTPAKNYEGITSARTEGYISK